MEQNQYYNASQPISTKYDRINRAGLVFGIISVIATGGIGFIDLILFSLLAIAHGAGSRSMYMPFAIGWIAVLVLLLVVGILGIIFNSIALKKLIYKAKANTGVILSSVATGITIILIIGKILLILNSNPVW